jgi:hypothetical protein
VAYTFPIITTGAMTKAFFSSIALNYSSKAFKISKYILMIE